jgi:stage II sporulation protein GA (sporulation sigma-E factor processing peptidase)
MTVYADVLFAVNFTMDGVILWTVAKLTRQRVKLLRLALGALAMALPYCILVLAAPYNTVISLTASVVMLTLGLVIALKPRRIKKLLLQVSLGYIASFAIGGLGLALFYLTDLPFLAYAAAESLSWKLVAVCVVGSYAAVKVIVKLTDYIAIKRQMLTNVGVRVGGCDIAFEALVDTGHSLYDPISNSPVIIAEFEHVKQCLPEKLQTLFNEKSENDLSRLIQSSDGSGFYGRLRMIPFKSLGSANEMLIGFKPDSVTLGAGSPAQAVRSDVVIGIYNNQLTRDGRYQGLLAPELVWEDVSYEPFA